MATIDRFSLCTVPLGLVANKTPMGVATGFIWKHPEKHYLVTNWHVITGRNARTGKLELPARPDAFRALFNIRAGDFGKSEIFIHVRDSDRKPLWLVHPNGGRMDVVVLPLDIFGLTAAVDLSPLPSGVPSRLLVSTKRPAVTASVCPGRVM